MYGTLRIEGLSILRDGGLRRLGQGWGWPGKRIEEALIKIQSLVGQAPTNPQTTHPIPIPTLDTSPSTFPHLTTLTCAALASGWPWPKAIAVLARLRQGFFSTNTQQFWCSRDSLTVEAASYQLPWQSITLPARSSRDPTIMLYFHDIYPILIDSTLSLHPKHAQPGRRATSNFLPAHIRLPQDANGCPIWPKFRVTSLIERRHEWYRIIGNIDGVTNAIINGRMVYPRTAWLLRGSWLPNHPSFERPEVKIALGIKAATYIAQGAIEVLRTCDRACLYVEPSGAVDKPGPDKFRHIADSRVGNKDLDHWGVRLHNANDFACLLDWCYWVFLDDVSDAYHLACFMGCRGGLRWGIGVIGIIPDPNDPSKWTLQWGQRLYVGCSTGDCLLICDKSANGFCIDGCLMRWAVAHFGQGPGGCPLNSIAMCLLRYMARRIPPHQAHPPRSSGQSSRTGPAAPQGTPGVVWVDDFAFAGFVPPHPPCSGGLAGCPVCLAALPAVQADRAHWRHICPRLGIGLNDDKTQDCTQQPTCAGFAHDTVKGKRYILPKKEEKLVHCLLELGCEDTTTTRGVDRVRGRSLHYSACIPHLRVFCASFSQLLGTEGKVEYDSTLRVTPPLRALCQNMLNVIFRYAPVGSELWPVPPATLYDQFLKGHIRAHMYTLTWDAAPNGWAALARWWVTINPGRRVLTQRLLVGTWPSYASITQQAHREAWAGALSLQALTQVEDTHSSTVLMRNDASAAIAAFRKGSFGSPELQEAALIVNDIRIKLDILTPLLHVPGLALMAEGIDGASRAGHAFGQGMNVEEIRGPSITDQLWNRIQALADQQGWKLTIDLFATASNSRTDRYVSWFPEPDAEAYDAFSMGSWASSTCPMCGQVHQEAFYAYPPNNLLPRMVAKAVADGAVGIVVANLSVTNPVWHKLLKASVLPGPDGYVRIRKARHMLKPGSGAHALELALFPCDFGRLRGTPNGWSDPGCAGAFRPRLRHPCGSAIDADDRRALRDALPREVNSHT